LTPTQFHQLAELLPDPLLLISGDGLIVAANRAASRLLGSSQLAGSRLEGVTDDRRSDLDCYLRHCSRSRERLPGAIGIATQDGRRLTFRCEGALVQCETEMGAPRILLRIVPRASPLPQFVALKERMEQLHNEIVRRKRTEVELRERRRQLQSSAERLRMALEAGRMGTWEWDLQTNKVNWSTSLEEIHGLGPGTFEGTFAAFEEKVYPEDRARVLATIRSAVESGRPCVVEYRLVWPDGSVHWVESRGRMVFEGGWPTRMMGVCSDIGSRKREEDNTRFLADVSRSLATLIDFDRAMHTLVHLAVPFLADWCIACVATDDGSLRQCAGAHADPAKTELVADLAKCVGPGCTDLFSMHRVLRSGQPEIASHADAAALVAAAGNEKDRRALAALDVRSFITIRLAGVGRVHGVLTLVLAESGRRYGESDLPVIRDLAYRGANALESARLYHELRVADHRKDEFLATLAHELRNPLTVLHGGLQLLGPSDVGSDSVTLMQRQVDHLVRLVDDLLDVSRIARGKIQLRRESVELTSVIESAVEAALPGIEAQRHELTVDIPAEPIWLEADPVRLDQIVVNLLNNAAKYTDPGGHIHLEAHRDGEQAVFSVRDDGIGICKEQLGCVFDMFMQSERSIERSQGGLGLGLTLVKNLVEMHGGSVAARSEGEGQGSEFTVRLPATRHAGEREAEPESFVPIPNCRILVVDDHAGSAELLARLFMKLGDHDIHMAHDGWSALEAATRYRPEVIVLDVGLPRMNGYEVARRLRSQPEFDETLLVALTGYGSDDDRRSALDAGFDEHLVKPPSLTMLRSLLHRRAAESVSS
jgi:PAS domain S-box-containing protein